MGGLRGAFAERCGIFWLFELSTGGLFVTFSPARVAEKLRMYIHPVAYSCCRESLSPGLMCFLEERSAAAGLLMYREGFLG